MIERKRTKEKTEKEINRLIGNVKKKIEKINEKIARNKIEKVNICYQKPNGH